MKKLLIMSAVLISTAAFAQAPSPQEFNLKINSQQLELLGKALGKLPFDEVAPLMQQLRQQVVEQSLPKPVDKKPPKDEKNGTPKP